MTIKCPNCGGPAKYDGGSDINLTCEYCGSTIIVPERMRPAGAQRPAVLNATQIEEVNRLVGEGQSIQAIKLVREWTGLGLAEAKRLVDGVGAMRVMSSGNVASFGTPIRLSPEAVTTVRRVGCFAIMFPLILTVAILGFVAFVLSQVMPGFKLPVSGSSPFQIPTGLPQLVSPFARMRLDDSTGTVPGPDRADAKPDVLTRVFKTDAAEAERYRVMWIDTAKSTPKWQFVTTSNSRYAAGGDLVVVADKTRLVALDKTSGTTLWETAMPDQLAGVCENCLSVVGQRVVALTTDGTLAGYDAKSGRKVWSQRLNSLNRLFWVNETLLVMDRTDKSPFATQVTLLDLDGKEKNKFVISCSPAGQGNPIVGYTYEGYTVDVATQSLYTWYGSSNSCLQKYDLATGKLAWSSQTKVRSTQHDDAAMLAAGGRVFAGGANTLISGDANGKVTEMLTDPDYELRPLAAQGDVLLVRALRTRGTRRFELWGVDVTSGKRLWQTIFDKDGGPMLGPDRAAGLLSKDSEMEVWSAQLGANGLSVVRVTSKPTLQATVETFGLKDGVSPGRKSVTLKTGSLLVTIPKELEWRGDTAWLLIDSVVYGINTKTATVDYSVP
ncbi:MAG: ribosomal protein L7/L12 [Thermoflexales bacterium]